MTQNCFFKHFFSSLIYNTGSISIRQETSKKLQLMVLCSLHNWLVKQITKKRIWNSIDDGCFIFKLFLYIDCGLDRYDFVLFGLWCLTPLSTIFQWYHGDQISGWRKPEYPEKPLTCHKSLTLSHNVVSSTLLKNVQS